MDRSSGALLERWLPYRRPRPAAPALRLFCLPYAGGLASAFHSWSDELPSRVEVCAVQLPGRGSRLAEPLLTKLDRLVDEFAHALAPLLATPYALLGHSMGGMVAFELARRLRTLRRPQPRHVFVSATYPPHMRDSRGPRHTLPDADLIEELKQYAGTPKEVLEHEELMQIVLPLIRADFELNDTHVPLPSEPLDCPLTAFGGLDDATVPWEAIEGWRGYTRSAFRCQLFPGDHFFIHERRQQFLQEVKRDLRVYL